MSDQQDYYYVFTLQGPLENPDDFTLVGPFEDQDAADEYVEDRNSMTDIEETSTVLQLDDPDDVLAALKKKAKKAKKKAKKEAKHQKSVKETIDENDEQKADDGNGKKDKGKKKGKKDKAQPVAAEATDDDASDDAAPSTEGAAPLAEPTPEPTDHEDDAEEVRRRRISEAARKRPYAGQLSDKKDQLIEQWARNYSNHEVLGPLGLSPQQRRVIAALKWEREVSFANAHMPGTILQPAPVIGIDANGRIVVQHVESNGGGKPRSWAVYKNGNAADIKEPVTRLKQSAAENV